MLIYSQTVGLEDLDGKGEIFRTKSPFDLVEKYNSYRKARSEDNLWLNQSFHGKVE